MSLTNKVLYDIDQSEHIEPEQKATARKNIGAYEDKTPLAGGTGIPRDDLADDVQDSLDNADTSLQGVKINGTEILKDSDNKVDVTVSTLSSATPTMDGKASVGNSLKYAREDHIHPSDTSREDIANKTTVVLGTSNRK